MLSVHCVKSIVILINKSVRVRSDATGVYSVRTIAKCIYLFLSKRVTLSVAVSQCHFPYF